MNAVDYFKAVRDTPYRIPLTPDETDNSCYGKHLKLMVYLNNLGIGVRPALCKFYWSDLSLLPKEILSIPHDNEWYHLYLQFKNGEWKNLDATFDSGLEGTLMVNEWDGSSATKVSVLGRETYDPLLSKLMMMTGFDIEKHLKNNREFYKALNEWMEEIRTKKTKTS